MQVLVWQMCSALTINNTALLNRPLWIMENKGQGRGGIDFSPKQKDLICRGLFEHWVRVVVLSDKKHFAVFRQWPNIIVYYCFKGINLRTQLIHKRFYFIAIGFRNIGIALSVMRLFFSC